MGEGTPPPPHDLDDLTQAQADLGRALDVAREELSGVPLSGLVMLTDGADTLSFRHEHAQAAPFLNQIFIDKFLITLQNRQRIEAILGSNVAHGRQCVTVSQRALEDHRDNAVPQLPVDRLIFIPLRVHRASAKKGASLA